MEWLELFDINEKSLGKKIVRGYTPDDDEYVMIVYIFIKNKEGKFLFEKNAITKSWVVPGGHVNEKKPINSIKRECMEELGIEINTRKVKSVETLKKNSRLFKMYYLESDISLEDITIQKEEVEEAKYFSLEEIDNMIDNGRLRENNIIFIDSLKKYLHNKKII